MKSMRLLFILLFFCFCLMGCGNKDKLNKELEIENTDIIISVSPELIDDKKTDNNVSVTENCDNNDKGEDKFTIEDISNNEISSLFNENLCKDNEEVVYSFRTLEDQKVVSLCINNKEDYIIFRYGTKEKLEIVYPETLDNSWNNFAYCYYLRGGGPDNEGLDLNFITFKSKEYSFILYEKYYASEDERQYGINIINNENGDEKDMIGSSDSVIGTLINFRWDSKIIEGSLVDSLVME